MTKLLCGDRAVSVTYDHQSTNFWCPSLFHFIKLRSNGFISPTWLSLHLQLALLIHMEKGFYL